MKNRAWGIVLGLLISLSAVSAQSGGWVWQNNGSTLTTSTPNNLSAVTIWNKNASGCTLTLKSGAAGTVVISVCGTTFTISGNFSLGTANCYGWSTDTFLERTAAGSVGVAATCGGAASGQIAVGTVLLSGGQSVVGTETNALVFPVAGQFVWGSAAASGVSQWAWSLGGAYAPTHASVAGFLRMTPTITMPNAVAGGFAELRGYSQQPTFNISSKTGTVLEINGAEYDAPVISNGANMTVQDLHNVYIYGALLRGAATLTGKEYAFRVGKSISGIAPSRFEDDIFLTPQTGLITAGNTVTMSFTGNVLSLLNGTKAAGANIIIGDGTPTAPSLARFGQTGTGISFTSNNVRISHSGTVGYDMTNGRFTMYQNIQMGFSVGSGTADAIIGRAAANALKLMNAAEDTGVSVYFDVNGTLNVKSLAGADTATVRANVANFSGKYQINAVDGVSCPSAGTVTSVFGIITACSAPAADMFGPDFHLFTAGEWADFQAMRSQWKQGARQ